MIDEIEFMLCLDCLRTYEITEQITVFGLVYTIRQPLHEEGWVVTDKICPYDATTLMPSDLVEELLSVLG